MAAKFRAEGNAVDYTPAADVAAGDAFAFGALIAIASVDIPANTKGALQVKGIYEMPYDGTAVLTAGAKNGFNTTTQSVVSFATTTGTLQVFNAAAGSGNLVWAWINFPG
jgi:predicted RecA/RadA family phage recombinase